MTRRRMPQQKQDQEQDNDHMQRQQQIHPNDKQVQQQQQQQEAASPPDGCMHGSSALEDAEFDHLLQSYRSHACTPRILLPSETARHILLVAPLLLWLAATCIGIMLFSSLPQRRSDVEHFMLWFDHIFRQAGPLLPLIPWLLRWAAVDGVRLLAVAARRLLPGTRMPAGSKQQPEPRLTLPWACLAAYFAVASVRILLYCLHVAAQQHAVMLATAGLTGDALPFGFGAVVSDHVFLAASVVACLQVELMCSLSDTVKLEVTERGLLRSSLAAAALVLSGVLHACVCLDMYFTCRHYHHRSESLAGVALGLVLFQGPLLLLLLPRYMQQLPPYTTKLLSEQRGWPWSSS